MYAARMSDRQVRRHPPCVPVDMLQFAVVATAVPSTPWICVRHSTSSPCVARCHVVDKVSPAFNGTIALDSVAISCGVATASSQSLARNGSSCDGVATAIGDVVAGGGLAGTDDSTEPAGFGAEPQPHPSARTTTIGQS